jgi:hypothetical protein
VARGWDSKSIESQQDDARDERGQQPSTPSDPRRSALELARTRVKLDLERATQPAHREMLERALADLDARLTSK